VPIQNDLVAMEKSFLDLNFTASVVYISGSVQNRSCTTEEGEFEIFFFVHTYSICIFSFFLVFIPYPY
jgi:hypothetical protein